MKIDLSAPLYLVIFFAITTYTVSAQKQKYVKEPPAPPIVYMTEIKEKGYILIEDEWEHVNGDYRYTGCRWVKSRKGYSWKPGYWKQNGRRGVKWVNGRWI